MKAKRILSAAIAALGLSACVAAPAGPPVTATQPAWSASQVQLTAPDGRKIDASIWAARSEKAVVVFSHGFGAEPAAYEGLLAQWAERGFTVVAPLHVDSVRHPDRDRFNNQTTFIARITDLAVTRAYIKQQHPGQPLLAAGHSFGSLNSLIAIGAVTVAGPRGDIDVKGVVAFSSAGAIPGLITPKTYDSVRAPVLMITGDNDLVPGLVSDWRAHRVPFDSSPAGDKMLMVFQGANHNLVRDADAADQALILSATTDFFAAYALGDTAARARLAALAAPDGVSIERR